MFVPMEWEIVATISQNPVNAMIELMIIFISQVVPFSFARNFYTYCRFGYALTFHRTTYGPLGIQSTDKELFAIYRSLRLATKNNQANPKSNAQHCQADNTEHSRLFHGKIWPQANNTCATT